MIRTARAMLGPEVESVLNALAATGTDGGVTLNDLARATGLPTGHVGRHLLTLERDRLARYDCGTWAVTPRGVRRVTDARLPYAA